MKRIVSALAVLFAATTVGAQRAVQPTPSALPTDLSTMDLESRMKLEVVFAASKRP